MDRSPTATVLFLCATLAALGAAPPNRAAPADASRYWPSWRGPLGTGEAPQATPPLEWGEGRNVRWQVALPGRGKSTPIVWDDRVIVTTAEPRGVSAARAGDAAAPAPARAHPQVSGPDGTYEFVVIAYARADGRVLWRRAVRQEAPHEGTHRDGTFASPSAVTDGERIYAFFGSRGLYALDFSGKVLWEQQLGRMQTRMGFGEGASPAVHGGRVVVTWDHEGSDFIVALDAKTGREQWRRERDEPTTWSTPLIVPHGGRLQVVTGGTNSVQAYDLDTGEPLWRAPGLTTNVIPTPVAADGMVYAMSGFRGSTLRAIRLADARGEITGAPGLAWSYDRDTPYVPSPLLYRGALYFLKSNSGILTALDATSGAVRYTERLQAVPNVYASPVAAEGRIYIVGREGKAVVLSAGAQPTVLATNALPDDFDSSPALVDGEMFLRGAERLYCIAER